MMANFKPNFGHPAWVRQRELRQRLYIGHADAFYKRLYSSVVQFNSWVNKRIVVYGGIYSMDFSPDGSLLIATCNRNSIKVFDPLCRKLIQTVGNAQRGRIKKLKFLDSRVFASGGEDKTISLWDIRNLKERMLSLRGHRSNIVRNIEFSSKNNLLLSSGSRGKIHSWHLNSSTERELVSSKVFRSDDLLCMRLTPDESKMIMSTLRGYLLIVHDLDLNTLAEDLAGFNPGTIPFRRLQEWTSCSNADVFSRMRRRNRVEIVTEFPIVDGSSTVSALEIHPESLSALSRSTCEEKQTMQWLCAHDIREKEPLDGWDDRPRGDEGTSQGALDLASGQQGATPPHLGGREKDEEQDGGRGSGNGQSATMSVLGSTAAVSLHSGQSSPAESRRGGDEGGRRDLAESAAGPTGASSPELEEEEEEVGSPEVSSRPSVPRLTHYVRRKCKCLRISEELGFSPDGRIICSPCGHGVKLHAFSPEFSEQFVSWSGGQPIPLHEFATHIFHRTSVNSTKFSPRHNLIVSGDLGGRINWYQPVL